MYRRRFYRHTALLTGISDGREGMALSFMGVPLSVLRSLAHELEYNGYCDKAFAEENRVEMCGMDIMMCCAADMEEVVREILEERNYVLEIRI